MKNLSLKEQPRRNRAELIPLQENASILKWLESTGRLRDRDDKELDFEDRDEEIADMLVGEDNNYNNNNNSDDSDDSDNNSNMDDD
ncbi:MAG: DUF3134 family protein [Cyanobacteria bacterium P01_C01_bin.89]